MALLETSILLKKSDMLYAKGKFYVINITILFLFCTKQVLEQE